MAVIMGCYAYEDIERSLFPALKELWDTSRNNYDIVKSFIMIFLRYDTGPELFRHWESHNYEFPIDNGTDELMIWPNV